MKVWLVWKRDYNDTLFDEVIKIFDNKEKAEEFLAPYMETDSSYSEWYVEERFVE